jgi:hypothetical protein
MTWFALVSNKERELSTKERKKKKRGEFFCRPMSLNCLGLMPHIRLSLKFIVVNIKVNGNVDVFVNVR